MDHDKLTEAKAHALMLASRGIRALADGDDAAGRTAFLEALNYAERHLPDDDLVPWIRSGLGDALLKGGDYRGAIDMAGSALAFCASVRAPLASLTMAESYLRLGDATRAREYARQACALRGNDVLKAFSTADREQLGL